MKKQTEHSRFALHFHFCFWILLVSAGCAHDQAPGKAFAEQTVQVSSSYEKKGDLVNAVEELKVALAADPGNSAAREELKRIVGKRDLDAEGHYRRGLSLRESDTSAARKELLEALRLRSDYPEAEKALRELQLEAAESVIDTRVKKEEKLAERLRAKAEADEGEEEDTGEEYSLDLAISSYDRGDYDTAISEFSKMKARYPNDPDIQAYLDRSCYNSGISWFNKKNYNKALSLFNRVPKGFDHVKDYISKCKAALKSASRGR